MALVVACEVVAGSASPTTGAAVSAVALVALLNGAIAGGAKTRLFGVLALVPLSRVASLTLAIHQVPRIWWNVAIGVPVLVAAIAFHCEFGGPPFPARERRPPPARGLVVALTGAPLGLAGYWILRPDPLVGSPLWLAAVAIVVGAVVGLAEELIYRGMLQTVLIDGLGRPGIVVAALVYGSAFIGTRSAAFVAFMIATGLILGVAVRRMGLLWPAVVAHGVLLGGMVVVWPRLLR